MIIKRVSNLDLVSTWLGCQVPSTTCEMRMIKMLIVRRRRMIMIMQMRMIAAKSRPRPAACWAWAAAG